MNNQVKYSKGIIVFAVVAVSCFNQVSFANPRVSHTSDAIIIDLADVASDPFYHGGIADPRYVPVPSSNPSPIGQSMDYNWWQHFKKSAAAPQCGKGATATPKFRSSISERITGGIDAKNHVWTFMVAINDAIGLLCSGTLISATKVLSAASCFEQMSLYEMSTVTVSVGGYLSDQSDVQMTRRVSRIVIHSQYNSATYANDIAIVTLDTPVAFSETVGPVCLPPATNDSDRYAGQDAVILGWDKGTYESFTCEGQSKTLNCRTGQNIVIDFANYGRQSDPVCVVDPIRDAPNTCFTASLTAVVGTLCNLHSSCILSATNSFFGRDTCPGVFKYLQIKYRCEKLNPFIVESFTCEGESKTLTCPSGTGVVVDFANYGRTLHAVCVIDPVRDKPNSCYTASHTNFVATFCFGQSSCVVPATTSFFGSDTCPGVYKYLQIEYHCQKLTPTDISESFTCEGQSKTLACPTGQSIVIDFANFGRQSDPVCVVDPVRDAPNTCFNPSHTITVANSCNGKSSCVVLATTTFFGNIDPCPGVYKYLQIKYHCA